MGRATRWLRRVLLGKKEAKAGGKDNASISGYEAKERKRWSFANAKLRQEESPGRQSPSSATDVAWLRSFYDESEENGKHAIAVAVATAAAATAAAATAVAATAAVSSAQAAVWRLRSLDKQPRTLRQGSYDAWWAAVKIQTAFRGHLAKKARRALKALVKLQALVRGYLVRKQAAVALRRLQALMRAQSHAWPQQRSPRLTPEFCHRRSYQERISTRCKQIGTEQRSVLDRSQKIVEEMDSHQLKSKSFRRTTSNRNSLEEPMVAISSPLPHKTPSLIWHQQQQHLGRWPETPRHPSHLAKTTTTMSFAAKVRTQSAPNQQAEKSSKALREVARDYYLDGMW